MHTLVLFAETDPSTSPTGRWKNRIWTRSMRKAGFIDDRYPKDGPYPRHMDYWLVEIMRENRTGGGCFIVRPIHQVDQRDLTPLIVGMYDLDVVEGDTVIVTPKEPGKFWVMTSNTKRAIMAAIPGTRSIIINHGGQPTWPRRRPAEDVLEREAKRLLEK